jgi:hypothetical protein
VRSDIGSCCWPLRTVEGSGSIARPCPLRRRNPRFTEPSGLMLPRGSGVPAGGDTPSDSGDPMELFAISIPDA